MEAVEAVEVVEVAEAVKAVKAVKAVELIKAIKAVHGVFGVEKGVILLIRPLKGQVLKTDQGPIMGPVPKTRPKKGPGSRVHENPDETINK